MKINSLLFNADYYEQAIKYSFVVVFCFVILAYTDSQC